MEIREHGSEQSYVPMGIFKLRLPFLHFGWAWSEAVQGYFLVAIAISIIPINQELLGIPFEVGLLMVILNTVLYLLHPLLGDPIYPGWITPAIPYVVAWVLTFPAGTGRVQAVIALQLLMSVIFFLMGITGMATKIMRRIPRVVQSGILLGASISAIISTLHPESGRMKGIEISVIVGTIISYFVLYSPKFELLKQKNPFWRELGKYGMLPGIVIAFGAGLLFREVSPMALEFGLPPFERAGELLAGYTILGVGIPGPRMFLNALPTAIACYIIAFGDNVLCRNVVSEARAFRPDEAVDYNISRSNIICGVRNLILGIFAPTASLAGPIWTAGSVSTYERYKLGRSYMESIFDGVTTYIITNFLALLSMSVVSIFRPMLEIGFCITLMVQGYACAYMALEMVRSKEERGLCGIVAIIAGIRDVRYALIAGVVLYLIMGINSRVRRPGTLCDAPSP